MIKLEILELHVANTCNLACESCSHFSNSGHRGILTVDDANAWMQAWNERILPTNFVLLGGEPTMNPRLTDIVLSAAKHWPQSTISLTTNGFFLHKHPDLPSVLQKVKGSIILSVHHDSREYLSQIAPALDLISRWRNDFKFGVYYINSYEQWTRRYLGSGGNITPYSDGNPRSSWENCAARLCRQLFRGKIWKCSPITYLQLQKEKYPAISSSWDRYLSYTPLDPNCTESELDAFLSREQEDICNMCPAKPMHFRMPSPLR